TEWKPNVSHSLQLLSRLYWLPRIRIQLLLPDIRNRLYIPIIWGFRNPTLLLQDAGKLYRPISLSGDRSEQPPDITDNLTDNLFDRISPDPLVSEIQIGFSEECREDIARYLTDKFNTTGGPQLGESDISQLVERSCGQFLYASTIVKLLDDSHPKDVLEMARNSSLPTPDLNKLYKVILERAKDAIRSRAQEGGPEELRILMDTLAILIVFAENAHFFNVRENFPAIESLIGIEKSRLTKKLSKLHSVLNVVPGISISVHHRSFLEFLQSQKRSGEHYVAYPKSLRRFLVLLSRAGLKYFVLDWCGQLLGNGRKMREDLENLALACRRNYFKRSNSPVTLIALHDLIHYSLPFICLVPICQFIRQWKESFIGAPTSSSAFAFILEYVFLGIFCLLILSSGSFIVSLTIYTLLFNLSLVLPLFHPLLHLHFVTMVGILLSSRKASSLQSTSSQANNAQFPTTVPADGASPISRPESPTETGPFSSADAAIMADAFRKALRKPDFTGRVEEDAEPEVKEGIITRELAEEGRDIRSLSSSRGVRVETLSTTVPAGGASSIPRPGSPTETGLFSHADAAIMADAFRKALRKPDFTGRVEVDAEPGVKEDIITRGLTEH
ncbi:hypothetical protein M378DRAFT_13284, partial [Amanita muscaria Koide BX008]